MSTYYPKVVDVKILAGATAIDVTTFDVPMFFSRRALVAGEQRVQSFISTQSLLDAGYAVGSPAVNFATTAFSGINRPSRIKFASHVATGWEIDFANKVNADDATVNFNTTNQQFSVVVAKGDAAAMATALKTAVDATNILKDSVTATVSATKVTLAPKASKVFTVGFGKGSYTLVATGSETITAAYAAAVNEDNNFFYVASETHKDDDVVELARLCMANDKIHAYSSSNINCLVKSNTDHVGAKLKAISAESCGIWNERADIDFPEAGIIGAAAGGDPQAGDSLHLKTMKGVTVSKLTDSQKEALITHNMNYYATEHGTANFYQGWCADNNFIDFQIFKYWFKARVQESIFGFMKRRSDINRSLKFSNEDLPVLKSVIMRNPIQLALDAGGIVTGLDPVTKMDYTPVIFVPSRGQVPVNDLANRFLDGVKVEVVYAGSVHNIKISCAIVLDKE